MDIGAKVKHIAEGKTGKIINSSFEWNLVLWDNGDVKSESPDDLEVIREDVGRVVEEIELDQDKILSLMASEGWGDSVVNNMEDFEKSRWFKNPQTEEEYASQFDMYMNELKVGHNEEELAPGIETPTAEPLPTLNPQDKITINGIPVGDKDAGYNGKQAVVVSVDPEGTTLNIGGQNVKFNKPQYLKKLSEELIANEGIDLTKDDIMNIEVTGENNETTTVGELLSQLPAEEVYEIEVNYEGQTYTVGQLLGMIDEASSDVGENQD